MSNTSNTQTHKNKETLRAFLWPRPLEMSLTWVRNLVKKDTTHCYRGWSAAQQALNKLKRIQTEKSQLRSPDPCFIRLFPTHEAKARFSLVQETTALHTSIIPVTLHWLDWAGIINTFHHLLFKAFRYCIVVWSLIFLFFCSSIKHWHFVSGRGREHFLVFKIRTSRACLHIHSLNQLGETWVPLAK